MVNKIDKAYYKEDVVQLMVPILNSDTFIDSCTFIGPNGIKFHSNYGEIIIDDYIEDSKAKLFPYHDIPIHSDDMGTFANQLFELNKQYLAIYTDGEDFRFRSDYFFEANNEIYDNVNVDLKLFQQESKKISLEELKEKIKEIILTNDFVCFINDDGEIYECEKEYINFEVPLSGIAVFGNGKELKANVYKMKVDGDQIFIESSRINTETYQPQDLDNISYFPEPSINKM